MHWELHYGGRWHRANRHNDSWIIVIGPLGLLLGGAAFARRLREGSARFVAD